MSWQTLSFLIPYLISAVISIGIGLYAWRRRDVAGAVAFSMGALSQAAWTLGYVFELASPGLEAKIFWDDVQFIAASISPLTFLAFAFQYTGRKSPHPRRTFALLAIPLIIFVLLVPTDDLHGLIRPAAWLVPGQPFPALVYDFTALVKVVTLYGLGLIVTGILMLTLFLARSPSLYRAQAGVIILGALFPLVGTALTLAGITLGFHRDTTPFTFAIRNLLIAWGLFRYRLFDVVPVARDKVIESMGDAVVVLDARNRLVDLNPATQELIGQPASEAIGQPAAQVFSAWSDLVKR
jgi:PAS domain-containing protein